MIERKSRFPAILSYRGNSCDDALEQYEGYHGISSVTAKEGNEDWNN